MRSDELGMKHLCNGDFRIRLEHRRAVPVVPLRRLLRHARVAVLGGVVLAVVTLGAPAAFAGGVILSGSGGTNWTITAVPSAVSVTVSQSTATFGNCSGGNAPTASSTSAIGYPNGKCLVGAQAFSGAGGSTGTAQP